MKSAYHKLTNTKLLSCNQGELVPIGLIEALPGDRMQVDTSALIRVQPLLAPIMHKVECKIHHWFVPMRLIWDDWEDFITGGMDGLDDSVLPYITTPASTGFDFSTLADYLGVTPEVPDLQVSALPFRAYSLIFNNFYRDELLVDPVDISTASGADSTTNTDLLNGAWEKDYFTSARPYPQLGSEVTIPLTGNAPVLGIGGVSTSGASGTVHLADGTTTSWSHHYGGANLQMESDGSDGTPQIHADLSDISAININDLRLAAALQRYKEIMLRFGARYVERLMSGFGVRPQDQRLQLPEYLGGGQQTIQFSEVLQTAEGTDPVGEMRGHGIGAMRSNKFRRFVPEHGYIMTMLIVRPKTIYTQSMHRTWFRQTKEDFFQPELAHIGQQEVYNKELYPAHTTPDGTFGYQDRYDDYRFIPSTVAGEFRDTLDFWHMARKFSSDPALNSTFVTADPTNRVYATDADQLYIQAIHRIKAKRPVPRKGNSFIY